MELKNSFDVAEPPQKVWDFLVDVERVVPCMPGAELTEVVDEQSWKGRVRMRLGAVSLAYKGSVQVAERDDAARQVKLQAKGMESRGKGMAAATVTSQVVAVETGSRVDITTDLTISGAAAQYGRGMLGDVSQKFTAEFAEVLAGQLAAEPAADEDGGGEPEADEDGAQEAPAAAPPAQTAKPISGLRLGVWLLYRAVVRAVRRLFGKAEAEPAGDEP